MQSRRSYPQIPCASSSHSRCEPPADHQSSQRSNALPLTQTTDSSPNEQQAQRNLRPRISIRHAHPFHPSPSSLHSQHNNNTMSSHIQIGNHFLQPLHSLIFFDDVICIEFVIVYQRNEEVESIESENSIYRGKSFWIVFENKVGGGSLVFKGLSVNKFLKKIYFVPL